MSSGETDRPRIRRQDRGIVLDVAKFQRPALALLFEIMRGALFDNEEAYERMEPSVLMNTRTPRWPTGIEKIDAMLDGGLYGITAVSGSFGVGKSLLAFGIACEAARAGWRVFHFDAEMAENVLDGRARNYLGQVIPQWYEDLYTTFMVSPKPSLRGAVSEIGEELATSISGDRVLIVLDSINTLATLQAGADDHYFDVLEQMSLWAMRCRRESQGEIAFLFVSEENARGDLKGLKLQYIADVVLSVKRANAQDRVEIVLKKSRESATGDLGEFVREWNTGRFKPSLGYEVNPAPRSYAEPEDSIL